MSDIIVQVPMGDCCLCREPLSNGKTTVTIREKGAKNINEYSKLRNDSLCVEPGQTLHQDCRREYTNMKSFKGAQQPKAESRVLRSKEQFTYKDNCLFCGQQASQTDTSKRGIDVFPVRTKDFQINIEKICRERNDSWSTNVLSRIQFVQDLHAADTVYHQKCSVNFRTGKSLPSPTPNKKKTTGRPPKQDVQIAFQKTMDYLIEHEDEQITVIELIHKMSEFCGDMAYTSVHMKSKLQDYFGDNVIITELNGKRNVITLRKTARVILHEFHQNQSLSDPEQEKRNIIETAANLIKSYIQSIESAKNEYPSVSDIESIEKNLEYLPESLKIFLSSMFSERRCLVKLSSIGQAIVQATRPQSLIVPLQIGLAVQMHHTFGSRFLIDSLNSCGFSSSYSEVKKYELNAAITQKTDIP
jgi:hypothetical protein